MFTDTAEQEQDPLLGSTLADNYIVDSVLGEGGMGRVYLARHTRIASKRFAIKALHEEFSRHHEALARFKREAEAAALISNPHVVSVHDMGTTPDGRPFLVCDYLEGEELGDLLKREGQLPVAEAVHITRQVCSGLGAAHERGVTHRDVKPENVFLVPTGGTVVAKLLDFGVSRLADSGVKALTQAGIALGTPDFMSPEQARGKPVDHRADIYSTGVMLYTAVTGVTPFERETPHDTLIALLTEEAPPPTMLEPAIGEDLERVIMKAMAKDADDRYQSTAELAEALAPFGATQPPHPVAPIEAPSQVEPSQLPAGPSLAQPQAVERQAEATVPRPPSLADGVLLAIALFVAALLAVGGILTSLDVELELVGWLIAALVLLVALSAPLVLTVSHAWGDSTRTDRLLRRARVALAAGAAVYGLSALLVRFVQTVALEEPAAIASPLWDLWLFVAAGVAAGVAVLLTRFDASDDGGWKSAARRFLHGRPAVLIAGSCIIVVLLVLLIAGSVDPPRHW